MNMTGLLVFILFGGVAVAGFVVGIVFAILKWVGRFGGGGGLAALSERFPAPEVSSNQSIMYPTVTIGAIVYKRCMTLGMLPEGLYLARGSKRMLIP